MNINFKKVILLSFFIILLLSTPCLAAEFSTQCPSAILIHADTGKILYEKDAHKIMYPASTTKIMTAILVLENAQLTDIATVSNYAVSSIPAGYSHANLQTNEQFTIEQLLDVLLVCSANDAANVLAEHIAGSIANFADMMNKKAIEIGCKNTHFVNPSGLHSNDHFSTAYDLTLMGQYAMKNENFRNIVCKRYCSLPVTPQYTSLDRTFFTTNQLLLGNKTTDLSENFSSQTIEYITSNPNYYPYAVGIKTGFTTPAGNCLVAQSSHNGLNFIATVLGGALENTGVSQRYSDVIQLFNFGYENYTIQKVKDANCIIENIEVKGATKETKNLNLILKNEISAFMSKQNTNISPQITLKENLVAPIRQGEIVGHVKYIIEDIVYEADLIAETTVEKENILLLYFKILLVAFFILLLCLLIIIIKKKRNN